MPTRQPTYSDPDLYRCPFCGSADGPIPMVTPPEDEPPDYYIWCTACECSGPQKLTESEAVKAWNNRATETD